MASRRDFIRTIMMGSGAVYLTSLSGCERPPSAKLVQPGTQIRTATPQFKRAHAYLRDRTSLGAPSRTLTADVIVIGAGLSGLTAAALLEKQGKRVLVVESEYRAGGAAVSADIGNGRVPLGSVYFVEKTDAVQNVLAIAGVREQICPEDGYTIDNRVRSKSTIDNKREVDSRVLRDIWSDAGMKALHAYTTADHEGMKRFRDDVLAMGDNVPSYPLPSKLTGKLAAYDGSALEFVQQYNSPSLEIILDAYSRSAMGGTLAEVNAYCLVNFYSSEFGEAFDLPRYTFAGGTSVLSNGLASTLHDIHLDMLAVRVAQSVTGVTVDCVDVEGSAVRCTAGVVVIASPKFQIPYLLEDCSAARLTACKAMKYSPFATLHVISDEPLVQSDLYDTWHLHAKGYTDILNPNSVAGSTLDKNIATLYMPVKVSDRSMLQDEAQFAARASVVISEFADTLSERQRSTIREAYCWGWGHGLVIPSPGSHSGIAQNAASDDRRVVFANTDCDASPAIENAIENGAIAARKAARLA